MPDVDLARREGVELVNAGSWRLLSGSWEPNSDDILAAVEASKCPAVRRPKIKLGHLDKRFNKPDHTEDGTPSLGWFDNLRASADGNTLIGDQVALPWLSKVQPAAYPDRSVEGTRNARCALGHLHPFVVEAVSLLGETPPGIPTLKSIKSLDDLPAALGVTASGEDTEGGERVEVTIRAAAEDEPVHTGAMVALIPTAEDAERLAVEGGEPASELHVTLVYLGNAADLNAMDRQAIIDDVSSGTRGLWRLDADAYALSVFNPGDANDRDPCLTVGLSGNELDLVHDVILQSLWSSPIPQQHRPWAAHLTLAYTDDLGKLAGLVDRIGPVVFDRVRIAFGGQNIDIPLADPPPVDEPDMTAVAAAAGDDDQLKRYWLGEGLKRWADSPHPWTALYRQILKHVKNVDKARRIASDWYREHFGHMPNQKGIKASAELQPPPKEPRTASPEPPTEAAFSVLPAAEPEQEINPDPKEDPVSTDLSGFRSRLGLADDADEQAILSALDDLKAKAETPAEPTPEMVAASAAANEAANQAKAEAEKATAEKDELRKEVQILASKMTSISDELAAAKAEKAATVKASVIDEAARLGKFTPAEREQWEADYDEAPAAVTRVLASIAPGTAVPVMASGVTGPAEPVVDDGLGISETSLNEWAKQLGVDAKELSA